MFVVSETLCGKIVDVLFVRILPS